MLVYSAGSRGIFQQVVLPIFVGVAVIAVLMASFLLWSTAEGDRLAGERQRRIVATLLTHNINAVAHEQEGSTIWDDAVRNVRAPKLDFEWLDANLGIWFNQYFHHDETYVLNADDEAIYAMRGGHRANNRVYARDAAPDVADLVSELRADLQARGGRAPNPTPGMQSIGAIDLGVVNGHPAIISAKPIISDTGRVHQQPGTEYVHLSIRYLDHDFLTRLSREYWLDRLRFTWSAEFADPGARITLKSHRHGTIGYLTWQPFAPGTEVLRRLAPALIVTLLLGAAVAASLLKRLRRRTMELHASEAHAHHLAFHDGLTGLANRTLFENRLETMLAAQRRGGSKGFALLFLDLDGFKAVNDTLGHPAGDELICELGSRLVGTVREMDMVARIGGDEFAIIQTDVDGPADVEVLCMRIMEAVHAPFEVLGSQVNVGISIGVAMAPQHGVDRVELGRKADIALYSAKTGGRGRFVVFADEMDDSLKRRRAIERELRLAVQAGDPLASDTGHRLELLYQPVYSAFSTQMMGVEALVRWDHPELGRLAPSTFIPIAEETGLIEPLGEWVLACACRTARDWPVETVAVNVSAVQLRNPHFAERTIAIVEQSGFDPRRLELEITETSFLGNVGHCSANLAALRAHGIRIALDDFGTGYSSLNHLRLFHVDRLKIDRSFVTAIGYPGDESPIIRAIVDLAKASGIKVTAEGVETVEQRNFLTDVGCDMLQGYLYSRPVSRSAIEAMFQGVLHRS